MRPCPRTRILLAAAAALLAPVGCAPREGGGRTGRYARAPRPAVLRGLGGRFAVRAEAGSWEALVEKVKPTFIWNDLDMMWIAGGEAGQPVFTMDRAHVLQPEGGPERWALLSVRRGGTHDPRDSAWAQVCGNWLRGTAKLHEEVPVSDHGSGDYAVVKAKQPEFGTVYEVGWQALTSLGTGHYETERRLYVLRDAAGAWRFIGEGPEISSGKQGYCRMYTGSVQSRVEWTGRRIAPVRVRFTVEDVDHEWLSSDDLADEEPDRPPRAARIEYRDAVLAGRLPARLRWTTDRPYMLAKEGDSFESVAGHLARWTGGWELNRGEDRRYILAMWRNALARLNPRLPKGEVPAGTRIRLLTYGEVVEERGKHPRFGPEDAPEPKRYKLWSEWGDVDGERVHRHYIQREGDAEPIFYYTDQRATGTVVGHRLGCVLVNDFCATKACHVKVVGLESGEARRIDGPALAMYERNVEPGRKLVLYAMGAAFSPDDAHVLLRIVLAFVQTGEPREGESLAGEKVRLMQRCRKWYYAVDARTGEVVREHRTDRLPVEWWRGSD